MSIAAISHVAYRCRNAAETVDFYERHLGLRYTYAVAENKVPSTGEHHPHIHIFLELADKSCLGFFELSGVPEMTFDPNTPRWVQHIALKVDTVGEVQAVKDRLVAAGVDVLGVTDHGIFQSIYFFDPSGHRVEVTCETMAPDVRERLEGEAHDLLRYWEETKRAPDIGWHRSARA